MIYLTTGANGAGKTLLTLRDVREQQLRENRPVYFHGFEAGEVITREFGWLPFKPAEWQDLPDGSICVFDECQNEFPPRKSGSEVPAYINAIAQFRRKRGFDFWLIAPHPMLLDNFVRRLIENPSFHRHLKRAAGAHLVSVLKWNHCETQADKPGSGASGEVTMTPYPKEVFQWYRSASLHTGKRKIPRAIWVVLSTMAIVPFCGWLAWSKLMAVPDAVKARTGPVGAAAAPLAGGAVPGQARAVVGTGAVRSITEATADYLAARIPRLGGLPHTAQVYDKLTDPVDLPYPAACVAGRLPVANRVDDCRCWTTQGTLLQTPVDLCRQIVAQGYFMDWQHAARPSGVLSPGVPGGALSPGVPGGAAASLVTVPVAPARVPMSGASAPVLVVVSSQRPEPAAADSGRDYEDGRQVRANRAGSMRVH
jgi:zona occludens toxin